MKNNPQLTKKTFKIQLKFYILGSYLFLDMGCLCLRLMRWEPFGIHVLISVALAYDIFTLWYFVVILVLRDVCWAE